MEEPEKASGDARRNSDNISRDPIVLQDQASADTVSSHVPQPPHQHHKGKEEDQQNGRPRTPDIIKELEELMGGVEAMVSSANFDAENNAAEEKGRGGIGATEGGRQGDPLGSDNTRDLAGKLRVHDVSEEVVLPPPLRSPSPPHQISDSSLQTERNLKAASRVDQAKSPERKGVGWSEDSSLPAFNPALSPEREEDWVIVIDPPSPWQRRKENHSSPNRQEPASMATEDNLATVSSYLSTMKVIVYNFLFLK